MGGFVVARMDTTQAQRLSHAQGGLEVESDVGWRKIGSGGACELDEKKGAVPICTGGSRSGVGAKYGSMAVETEEQQVDV